MAEKATQDDVVLPFAVWLSTDRNSSYLFTMRLCRDTSWAPVSAINPQSTARYSSEVPASRDSNLRC
jgi:hypothetical protein